MILFISLIPQINILIINYLNLINHNLNLHANTHLYKINYYYFNFNTSIQSTYSYTNKFILYNHFIEISINLHLFKPLPLRLHHYLKILLSIKKYII